MYVKFFNRFMACNSFRTRWTNGKWLQCKLHPSNFIAPASVILHLKLWAGGQTTILMHIHTFTFTLSLADASYASYKESDTSWIKHF